MEKLESPVDGGDVVNCAGGLLGIVAMGALLAVSMLFSGSKKDQAHTNSGAGTIGKELCK